MPKLKSLVEKVRSKNAGPFWITVDIFCHSDGSLEQISEQIPTTLIAELYKVDATEILRFELKDLDVLKLSFPRPIFQGTKEDRDMHGAAYAHIIEEIELP
ncbi:MAG: DUF4387 family protein [Pseudomonadota bacterium]